MELSLLVHPAVAAGAVVSVLAAYLLKTRKKLYFRLHYAAGILAFALSITAFPVGLYLVYTNGGVSVFPEALTFHSLSFFAAIGLVVVQGGLGTGMLLFGRRRDVYRTHKRMAKYVLAVFLLQGALGLLTLYGILPSVFGS
jgi:heme A synthase